MPLNHPYTCPRIDECLEAVEDELIYQLSDFLREDLLDGLKKDIVALIEDLRTANEELRSAADAQIAKLEDYIDELEARDND